MGPETVELSPYVMLNVPLFFADVDEAEAVYLFLELQTELVQSDDGTQRSEDPAVDNL
jgi:exo-beta-1,3-glucanase (GH17 family)